jgi:glyoxylase-like metal-dependent hydrolase (beta-lactamase superfamily II)/ferredoxin
MANPAKRLPQNVAGDFFVDDTCIDCDACRQIAPDVFRDHGDQSSVFHQPETKEETRRSLMALAACPVGSIGTIGNQDTHIGVKAFPTNIAENIYFCGFTSEKSFGAWSYLIVRPENEDGNVLVDSPRFTGPLVKKIEAMGGVRKIFLTHQDDIADHARFAGKFGADRFMHEDDGARRRGMENPIMGPEPFRIDDDLLVIPTPGHTRGSAVLLYREKFLFTGDHLAWSPTRRTLMAFRSACWYKWSEQIHSMERLLEYSFEWVLPGHGRIHKDTREEMREHLMRCVEWMKTVA